MKQQLCIFNYSFIKNSTDSVDIFIDGGIVDEPSRQMMADWWGDTTSVSFKSVRDQILTCGTKNICVNINSGGGHLGDGLAMHDLIIDLNNNKGYNIRTFGCGIIASAATPVLMSGEDNSEITENSMFMIHNVSGGIYGDVNEVENYARMMRKYNDLITNLYSKKTGKTTAEVADLMNKETWMDGETAVTNGFVKKKAGSQSFTNVIKKEQWPFQNMAVLNTYNSHVKNDTMDFKKMKTELENTIKNLLGLKDAKPEDTATGIANAVTDVLEKYEVENKANIENLVSAAMKGDAFNTAVATALNAALATVPENITTAITTATNGLAKADAVVTTAAFDTFKTELTDKLGNKLTLENKAPKKGDVVDKYAHDGVTMG